MTVAAAKTAWLASHDAGSKKATALEHIEEAQKLLAEHGAEKMLILAFAERTRLLAIMARLSDRIYELEEAATRP